MRDINKFGGLIDTYTIRQAVEVHQTPEHRLHSPPHEYKAIMNKEMILKANCEQSSRHSEWMAPGVFLVGSVEAYRPLARFLDRFAADAEQSEFVSHDPDSHEHLDDHVNVNAALSDDFGLMFGIFREADRRKVLRALQLTKSRRVRGTPFANLLDQMHIIDNAAASYDDVRVCVLRDLPALIDRTTALLAKLKL